MDSWHNSEIASSKPIIRIVARLIRIIDVLLYLVHKRHRAAILAPANNNYQSSTYLLNERKQWKARRNVDLYLAVESRTATTGKFLSNARPDREQRCLVWEQSCIMVNRRTNVRVIWIRGATVGGFEIDARERSFPRTDHRVKS